MENKNSKKTILTIATTLFAATGINFGFSLLENLHFDNVTNYVQQTPDDSAEKINSFSENPAEPIEKTTPEPVSSKTASSNDNSGIVLKETDNTISKKDITINSYDVSPKQTESPKSKNNKKKKNKTNKKDKVTNKKNLGNTKDSLQNNNNETTEEPNTSCSINISTPGQLILMTDSDKDDFDEKTVTIYKNKTSSNKTLPEDENIDSSAASSNETANDNISTSSPDDVTSTDDKKTDNSNNNPTDTDVASNSNGIHNEEEQITFNISEICNCVSDDEDPSTINYISISPGTYDFSFDDCIINVEYYFIPDINTLYSDYNEDMNSDLSDNAPINEETYIPEEDFSEN